MSTPTQPTAGAMRAAKQILDDISTVYDVTFFPSTYAARAKEIDEATALPELIAALEAARNRLSLLGGQEGGGIHATIAQADMALAKARKA